MKLMRIIKCPKEVSAVNAFENCCRLLPETLRRDFGKYRSAEEIRLRCGMKPTALVGGVERMFSQETVSEEHILHVLEVATGASIHSAINSLENGYISYKGIRIGVCGQAIYSESKLVGFRKYTSLAIRVPHQPYNFIPPDISHELCTRPQNLLIAAPPGVGKTTALREIVRMVSEAGFRVALVDERGELSNFASGLGLGPCTDAITDVPKAEAAIMLLRSMNPQIIAMDEISSQKDSGAIFEIAGCGVSVFSTAHGKGVDDMLSRPAYKKLMEEGVFELLLSISMSDGKRQYKLERIHL